MQIAKITQLPLSERAKAFLTRKPTMLIDGKWVPAQSGETLDVEDPATRRIISKIPAGASADIDAAVAAARRAFEGGAWPRVSPFERSQMIWRLADLIEANGDELAELEAIDGGKPLLNARQGDVQAGIDTFRYISGWATRLTGETIPVSAKGDWHAYTVREPVGVVGQIIPWNFPIQMAAWKLAPALAAGCTVVLKPAEQTSLTALRMGELIQEAGFPGGVVNIVTGEGEAAGAPLASHPDVDKIAFTGSTEVGKLIVKAAAGNLKRVSLELGGKSPAIVFPDADIDLAVAGTSNAIFYHQGQTCTAGSRLYVHKSIFDNIVNGVVEKARNVRVGHGLDPQTTFGPLISHEQHKRVVGYIAAGTEEGAELVVGGGSDDKTGYFVEPTVLANTRPDMRVVRDEIFGPVLCVQRFSDEDLDQIAAFANATEYGLQASVWTKDLRTAHLMTKKIRSGTVCINAHLFGDPAWPIGGYKQSGWGREMGKEVMEHYTELKAVAARL